MRNSIDAFAFVGYVVSAPFSNAALAFLERRPRWGS